MSSPSWSFSLMLNFSLFTFTSGMTSQPVETNQQLVHCTKNRLNWIPKLSQIPLEFADLWSLLGLNSLRLKDLGLYSAFHGLIWLQLPECFEASYCIQYFFFCEESLVRDTNLHNKDCNKMHSGSCSQRMPTMPTILFSQLVIVKIYE